VSDPLPFMLTGDHILVRFLPPHADAPNLRHAEVIQLGPRLPLGLTERPLCVGDSVLMSSDAGSWVGVEMPEGQPLCIVRFADVLAIISAPEVKDTQKRDHGAQMLLIPFKGKPFEIRLPKPAVGDAGVLRDWSDRFYVFDPLGHRPPLRFVEVKCLDIRDARTPSQCQHATRCDIDIETGLPTCVSRPEPQP